MKLVSLAVIAALGGASFVVDAAPVSVENYNIQTLVQPDASLGMYDQASQRLAQHGINAKNRPHLFKVLQTTQAKNAQQNEMGIAAVSGLANPANTDCSTEKVCSFFTDMGFRTAVDSNNNDYVIISAINSETAPTTYTFLDLSLVNEHGETITIPRYIEYFGEHASTKKRMDITSVGRVNDIIAKLLAAEKIYANAYAVVTYINASGVEVAETKQMSMEYSKDTLLADLGYVRTSVSGQGDEMSIGGYGSDAEMNILPASDYSKIGAQLLERGVTAPVDRREINETDPTQNRIKVCLNRRYADCDIDAYYDPGTPNDQIKAVVPFTGFRDVMGRVTKIYRPDWSTKNVTFDGNGNPSYTIVPKGERPVELYHGTEIFIQTKELGGATALGGGYQGSSHLFSDHINLKYFTKKIGPRTFDMTRISWNIPRSKGIFGDARLYGRYEDAHWIMNLSIETEETRGTSKLQRRYSYVVGSADMPDDQSWKDIEHPPLQMVFSCLAKGSMIKLANGKELPIEQLRVGDTVLGASQYAPNIHLPLEIKDVSIGSESQPMIKLITESGKELLLTESHPVVTQSGVSSWANKVQVGDRIRTASGLELITHVEEQKYNDHVYNLKLARTADDPNHNPGETFSMFANGLQVGDLAMQTDNEFEEVVETEQETLKRIPEAWHKDYLNSLNK
ncbi:hypothetical protein J8M21_14750 [Pseudoalteromonas luteoviolacea]|uniref:Hint domain-containing protein n=1 Tax=Pseudoalteromonas luteoviolacea TaxID=43657 RepID=UPI001B3A23A9|nr:Hint domain-containing protein [Pseudoalteromonas luteoviolacea]MBQ4878470.1 hypothetical protein [Pseudoalteromonas luteoviolacea]MBQ4907625.1 hypothetical protein [Pseudoalteromonas luteoviolacea]